MVAVIKLEKLSLIASLMPPGPKCPKLSSMHLLVYPEYSVLTYYYTTYCVAL